MAGSQGHAVTRGDGAPGGAAADLRGTRRQPLGYVSCCGRAGRAAGASRLRGKPRRVLGPVLCSGPSPRTSSHGRSCFPSGLIPSGGMNGPKATCCRGYGFPVQRFSQRAVRPELAGRPVNGPVTTVSHRSHVTRSCRRPHWSHSVRDAQPLSPRGRASSTGTSRAASALRGVGDR